MSILVYVNYIQHSFYFTNAFLECFFVLCFMFLCCISPIQTNAVYDLMFVLPILLSVVTGLCFTFYTGF